MVFGDDIALQSLQDDVHAGGGSDDAVGAFDEADVAGAGLCVAVGVFSELVVEGAPCSEVGPSEVGWEDGYAALSAEELGVGASEGFHYGVVDGYVGALWEYLREFCGFVCGVEGGCELVHERGYVGLELS